MRSVGSAPRVGQAAQDGHAEFSRTKHEDAIVAAINSGHGCLRLGCPSGETPRMVMKEGTRVLPHDKSGFAEIIERSRSACDALSADDDGLKREVLAHAGNRWSLGVVHALGVGGTLRHAEIARQLEGVSQRMLTRTLRQLERAALSL